MVGRKKCESKLMLISGNRDTERHTCDIHSQFIVILCTYIMAVLTLPFRKCQDILSGQYRI